VRLPIFSLPHPQFEHQPKKNVLFTTTDSIFIIRGKRGPGPIHAIELPENCLPMNLAPTTINCDPNALVFHSSRRQGGVASTDGFKYLFTHTLASRLRLQNEGILTAPLDPNEVTVQNFEKLYPIWLLPGLTYINHFPLG